MKNSTIQINLVHFDLKYLLFSGNKILVIKKKNLNLIYYVRLNSYFFLKNKNLLFLKNLSSTQNSSSFFYFFFQIFNKISKRILIFKGLGLKIFFNKENRNLTFKLGYSHLLILKIDKEIFIGIKKNVLFLQSFNKEKLGNFSFKIKNLRQPDCYRGKGIWYKNEKIKMKQFKKK